MKAALAAAALLLAVAGPALAQAQPAPYPYPSAYSSVGDQHRYEMDRLRYRSDLNTLAARQLELERRLEAQRLEAQRQPTLYVEPAPRLLRSREQEQADRQTQTRRRESVATGTSQIDRWLDRGRSD